MSGIDSGLGSHLLDSPEKEKKRSNEAGIKRHHVITPKGEIKKT